MAIGIVKTINGVKQLVPLTTDSGQGLPLGAWTSFEDDQPRNGYLKAGTTFNQADYPALYNMLGTNVVPERFDHNRLGDYENITISNNSSSPTVMNYDGVLFGSSTRALEVYINGELFDFTDHTSIAGYGCGTVTFKKGDNIYCYTNGGSDTFKVAYYKHPMFIKAVIGPIEDSAADQVVQNINNSRSYSTEEVNTGKKWIDGKPIYRKVFDCNVRISSGWFDTGIIDNVIDSIISSVCWGYDVFSAQYFNLPLAGIDKDTSNNHLFIYAKHDGTVRQFMVEYTKTTD